MLDIVRALELDLAFAWVLGLRGPRRSLASPCVTGWDRRTRTEPPPNPLLATVLQIRLENRA